MFKLASIILVIATSVFAEDFDNDRVIPDFTIKIQKGDTNFNFSREVEIKKITLNEKEIKTREMEKVKNPTFKIVSVAMNGEKNQMGME
jgi:uncharacterized protein YaiL (DUF2058 family)